MLMSSRSNELVVRSQKGLLAYILSMIGMFGAGFAAWLLVDTYVFSNQKISLTLTASALFGLLFFWFVPLWLTTRIEVSPEGLFVSSWRGKVQLRWEEVIKVQAVPTYFGTYSVGIGRADGGKALSLPAGFFANGNHLTKAIFEAAYKANPNVELAGWVFLNAEGHPPYGIFPEAKPTAPSRSGAEAEVQDHKAPGSS